MGRQARGGGSRVGEGGVGDDDRLNPWRNDTLIGAIRTLRKSDWNSHILTEEFGDYCAGNFRDFAAARS
jgi:hypothetical protein